MPRHTTPPSSSSSDATQDMTPGLATLPSEVLVRISQGLFSYELRPVCRQFVPLEQNNATFSWVRKHFPSFAQVTLSEGQQRPITFIQAKMEEIEAFLKNENPDSLLPSQLMPIFLELQHYELEPLYRDYARMERGDDPDLWKSVGAIMPKLAHIFLWMKTRNKEKLQEVAGKLTYLNLLWLLIRLDRNHLSIFDWAQLTGNQDFLDLLYFNASRLMYFNAGLGESRNGIFDARFHTNILQLAIRCNQDPTQFLKAVYSVTINSMIPLLNSRRENSLHFAAYNLNPVWLEHLLGRIHKNQDLAASLEQKNKEGLTPLQVAAQVGNWQAVSLFAKFGANARNLNQFLYGPNLYRREGTTTRFHVAVQCLSLSNVTNLLTSAPYFDWNTPDEHGLTLLHIACHRGSLKLVKRLVLLGKPDYLAINNSGWTPLHDAIAGNHIEILEYLLPKIKDLGQIKPTREGWGLSHWIIKYGNLEVIKLFKAQIIAELRAKDVNGDVPLALALKDERYDLVQDLLSLLPSNKHVPVSCLHLAAMSKDLSCLMQIVPRVVNIDAPDRQQNSALHLAAAAGNVRGVLYLLNANASINVRNQKKHLPDHYAKKSGNNILICLFECLRYRTDVERGHGDKKAEAARALESVLLGKADYAALEPYMSLFSSKVSPTLAGFYKAFLPMIAPHTEENDEFQMRAIASSSNSKF
ncbi:ankyrin repeat domain-containing protein [Legionella lytica]|uniref:Ankyrin repeat domain-containing protein n=1 Tax=Legionella lytica TaxID=96232 RepID=A0ABW8D8V6_9GAMM